MKINEVFDKKLRHSKDGVDVAGDIHVAVSATVNEPSTPDPPPVSPNLAAPVDAAVAFNVTKESTAGAGTEQEVDIDQNPESET